jgi:hypothetical protein
MRQLFALAFLLASVACQSVRKDELPVPASAQNYSTLGRVATSPKKGVGLVESAGNSNKRLDSLGVAWYYSWGFTTSVVTNKEFVPMVPKLFSLSSVLAKPIILGFNEPDNTSQANIIVSTALANWGPIATKAVRVGGPATAGNAQTTGSWQEQFMAAKPKVDFVCVHWYKGPDSKKFVADMTAIITKYNKPIWVTEFAPQTTASSTASPTKYTQAQVDAFIKDVIAWMEQQPMVERYAWHDSKVGTSAIYDANGNLTATGKTYRDAK